jgi:hypothetical protein
LGHSPEVLKHFHFKLHLGHKIAEKGLLFEQLQNPLEKGKIAQ